MKLYKKITAIKAREEKSVYNNYLKSFSISLAFVYFPVLLSYIFLRNCNEFLDYRSVISEQTKTDALFGSATSGNDFMYKSALVGEKKPELLIIGSSRVLALREEVFNIPVVNAGGGGQTVFQEGEFIRNILTTSKPKIVLLGLDYWHFALPLRTTPTLHSVASEITLNKIFRTFDFLYRGRITYSFFRNELFNKTDVNKETEKRGIGIAALVDSSGFRPDGSYQQGIEIYGIDKNISETAEHTFHRQLTEYRIPPKSEVLNEQRQELESIINLCKNNGITLVLFAPPLAPSVLKNMKNSTEYGPFIDKFNKMLSTLDGVERYNFFGETPVTPTNCEFFDGVHGGEVTYLRILQEMSNRGSILKPYLKLDLIKQMISKFSGRASVQFAMSSSPNLREVDFLKIGCKK